MERLAGDDRLPLDQEQLQAALKDRHAFIGAAESQVDNVLERIQTWANKYPEAAGYTPGEIL